MASAPQPGQQGGPPAQRKTGWWISIGGGVIGGFLVLLFTGLVAPGFLLNNDAGPQDGSASTADDRPPANIGGRTYSGTQLLDASPSETVRRIYHYVALNEPTPLCRRFTDEAAQQFATNFTTATCEQAVANLHTRVTGTKNAYAEPVFPPELKRLPDSDTIEISSCELNVTGGPRLGEFTVQKTHLDQWIVIAHRTESC